MRPSDLKSCQVLGAAVGGAGVVRIPAPASWIAKRTDADQCESKAYAASDSVRGPVDAAVKKLTEAFEEFCKSCMFLCQRGYSV